MHPFHRVAIAALLGLAAVAGLVGLTRTLRLGAATAAAPQTSQAVIARQQRQLDRTQASLRRALARRPPPLPAVPVFPAARPTAVAAGGAPAGAPRVTYVRPPPRVVHEHRAGAGDDHGDTGGHGDD